MRKTSVDLTEGNIAEKVLKFAFPILLGQIFQNLYNSVDSIVVGNHVGMTALAAVSSCSDMSHLLTGFFSGLAVGNGVLVARYFGAKNRQKLHDAIHTSLLFACIFGAILAAVGVLCAKPLLRLTDCPEDVFPSAVLYLRIYLVGILFTAMYNVGAGILRAVGDSKTPLYFLMTASVLNIILDLITVVWLDLGVAGVGIATVVSQIVSVSLVYRKLTHTEDIYKVNIKELKIDKDILKEVIGLGIPAGIQNSLTAIANLFTQKYINGFGSAAMAGIGAAKKIDKFAGLAALSIGNATSTFVAQNNGAGKNHRAIRGIRVSLIMAFSVVLIVGIPIYIFAPNVVRLFTKNAEAIQFGTNMIHVLIPLYFLQSLMQIFANAIRGFGKSRVVMVLNLLGMIGVKQLFLAVSMGIDHNVYNVYYSFPVAWGVTALLNIGYYFLFIKRRYKQELASK